MFRPCPECGKDIKYRTIKVLKEAEKKKTVCRSCSRKGDKNPMKKEENKAKMGGDKNPAKN
jgi:hypothetical protein